MPPFLSAGPFSARDGEGRRLFEGVSLSLDAGELVVLEGRSGGGKSTLLRQLVGMVCTEGVSRELDGEAFSGQQLPRWRSRVTLVAQDAPMLAGTVGENLRFPHAQRCAGRRVVDENRLGELLAATDLQGIPEERDVSTLSGGERHRLALVRGLLWDPPILVADEPLSGLDEEIAALCFELMLDFAHRPDHAVLCVLHERPLTDKADRRLRLEKDRIEVPS
jgi:ABC-type iron transport system FetAB ATPase subunit